MPGPETEAADRRVAALEAEVARLNKVVEALMDRSEASMNVQGSDFGVFQTTIMLQDQVRLQTEALDSVMKDDSADDAHLGSSQNMHTLRRTAALQIQLLELVVQQKDVGELVDRVGSILDIPIVLFDMHGATLASSHGAASSPGLAQRLWTEYKSLSPPLDPAGMVVATGERLFYRDVTVMGCTERVLAAVSTGIRASEFTGASLLFLQQLVALDLLRGRDELRMRRRLRRGLLRDILRSEIPPETLRVRLQAQGFEDESVLRMGVVEALPASGRHVDHDEPLRSQRLETRLLAALDAALSERRLPYLTSATGPFAVVLTELPDEGKASAEALLVLLQQAAARALPRARIVAGCSAPISGVSATAPAFQQAKAACIAARSSSRSEDAGIFEELTGHLRLLDGLDEEALSGIAQRTFAPLLAYDARHHASLFATLRALLEHGLAVQETANALHVHRNTLQKRLAHVERLLDIDLNDLDTVVDLRLGLHAAELLAQPLR